MGKGNNRHDCECVEYEKKTQTTVRREMYQATSSISLLEGTNKWVKGEILGTTADH